MNLTFYFHYERITLWLGAFSKEKSLPFGVGHYSISHFDSHEKLTSGKNEIRPYIKKYILISPFLGAVGTMDNENSFTPHLCFSTFYMTNWKGVYCP